MDVVEVDGGLYGFVTSRSTNAIYRVHFPRESDAAPVVTNLGNIGSLLSGPEQIKIVNEAGLWYGLVVNGATSSLIRLDFGTSLNNTPSAYHVLGGISTVNSGMDVVSSNGEWVAAVTNSATQKVTIINFGNSITNPLDLSDIVVTPSIPGISGADDVQLVYDDGSWFAFVVGFNSRSIHRLNFGPDWSSSPEMAVISGPAFTTNQRPSGVRVHPDAGRYVMFIQTFDGSLFRFDMGADIQNSSPAFSNLGNFGVLGNSVNLDLVKLNSAWHGFIINQSNLKVDRLLFEVVCPATTAVSEEEVPADIAYTEAGLYAVSLTIQDANAHTDYRSQYVTVTSLAAPQLEIMSENVCQTNVVHFQAQTMTEIVSYHWDFSDQSITSTSAAPDYQFSQSGIFDVALKAYASNGCSNTASKRITIFDAPVSSFWLPGSVCTNSNMLFLNTTPDVYNGNLSYEWYVDNNLISTSRDLNYIFTTTTPKTITLKTAIPGCEHEITQVTPTLEVGPIVDFSFSGTCQDEPFKFERQMSDLSDSYLWDFQDGQTSTDSDPTHPFASPGSYAVALTATNAQGCQTTKTRVVTVFAKPVVDFSVSESSYPCSGSPTRFQNRTTTADDSSITEWLWASNRAIEKVTSDEENPEIVFETPGTYPVSLTATTAAGCTATLEKDITIDPSPSTEFTHPPTCEDEPVLFTGPPDPLIESSYWEIGTSYSYDASPTHTFAAPGDYPLYAEFYGSNGCISRIRKTIHVPIPL
ncbi:MAG TPA: PKD domain-containing protein, partial [Chryseosolibacter sp.]|nr:PKD domain-containing protein [Chryseosolibacter sp.]